jgi:tungstate transport system substrate-binding protein
MRSLSPSITALIVLPLAIACGRVDSNKTTTRLVLAATTSIDDSGLLDVLASDFAAAHPEIELSPLAVGTGQAIELARRGDADVVLSHDSAAETQLVTAGRAKNRRSVMYNDFVIAGPADDPAHARGQDVVKALQAITNARASFISRGDDSGTHRRELALWRAARITPRSDSSYLEAGVGMGDALLLAGQKRAYILTDRATYLRFKPRLELVVLCEGDSRLLNHYGVTVMNGERAAAAETFADWITSPQVQRRIGEFGKSEFGRSLFTPSAR